MKAALVAAGVGESGRDGAERVCNGAIGGGIGGGDWREWEWEEAGLVGSGAIGEDDLVRDLALDSVGLSVMVPVLAAGEGMVKPE